MKKIFTFILFVALTQVSKAAVFTSAVSGPFSAPATWTVVGADADGVPDNTDDVIITAGKTITLTTSSNAKSITINATGTINLNSFVMLVWGNLTNNGTSVGVGTWQFHAVGTYSGNPINNSGTIYFYTNYTIAAGVVVNKPGGINISSNATVTNNGNITLTSSGILNIFSGGKWKNNPGSSLSVSGNVINAGTIDCSANPNTFTYATSGYTTVMCTNATYYNLVLSAPVNSTKTLNGTLNVLNDLTLSTHVILGWANNTINLGGNWNNTANITGTSPGTLVFNGAGTQTINRVNPEVFKNVTLSGTGTVQLGRDLTVNGTSTINSGTLDLSTFTYHQKGASFIGNGGTSNLAATGKIIFDGGISQTIGGIGGFTFPNVEFNDPGFTVQLAASQTGGATTTLTAGIFNPSTFSWMQTGTSWQANGGTLNTAATGDITFSGSAAQTIDGTVGATFGNIAIAGSSTVSLGRDLNVAGTLSITSGTLDISASLFNITLSGNFVHNGGTFTTRTGTVFLTGAAAQTLSGSATTTFYNITSNNTIGGVSVTSIIILSNILQVNSRSFGTAGSGNIILTATGPTTYARIGQLGATATLTGNNWSIGSYIDGPATAYWQYLGSPMTAATLADWDNDARFYMSGVSGNDGNACCPIFYSVKTFNPATNSYNNVVSVGTTLTPGKGFLVWMADNLNSLTAPLPFDTKGAPNQGTVLRAVTAGGPSAGYNLVSNPFACPITYASVVASSGCLGANFVILQENGSYVTNPNGGVIAPAQGFMCIATSNGNVKFLESSKTTLTNPNIIRAAAPENYLTITSSNATNGLGGQTVVQILPDAINGADVNYDMPFLPSPYEDATNIWTSDNDRKDLLLNALNASSDILDIPLTVLSGTPGNQLLSFKGINSFSAYSCAWVEDLSSGEKINLKDHDTYSFFASAAGEKHNFNLHFERTASCPLNDQNITSSVDASSQVFVNNGNILVQFSFEEKSDVSVTVFDALGQQVSPAKNLSVSNETIALDNPDAHGIYLIRITKGAETVTKKIYY